MVTWLFPEPDGVFYVVLQIKKHVDEIDIPK